MPTIKTWAGVAYSLPLNREPKGSWGTEVSNFLISLATNAVSLTGGTQSLSAEWNVGATFGFVTPYIKSATANIAAAGMIRLAKTDTISWRNNANGADLALGINVTDRLTFNADSVVTAGSTDTLTNKTLTGALTGAGGAVVGTTDTQTLTNKTLTTPVQSGYEDFTDISTPTAPAAGKTRVYSKNGNVYKQTATLPETLLGGGSGSGSKNYLSASTSTAAGWTSTGTATATTDTTTADLPEPSVGTGVLFTLGSAGNYSYARWTIDPSDYNSPRIILKAAIKALASYASGNAKIEVYSNTASNYGGTSTKLALSTDVSAVSGISTAQNYLGFYDNPGASAPYMELRIVTVTATGTLCMSSISTGPGQAVQGARIGAWKSYNPIITNAPTFSSNIIQWREVGEDIEIQGFLVSSSNGGGGRLSFPVPGGYTINTSIAGTPNFNATALGNGMVYVASGTDEVVLPTAYDASNLYFIKRGTAGAALAGSDLTTGSNLGFQFKFPVNELAGAATNLGQNAVEYATTSGAFDSTSSTTVYGPAGQAITALTADRVKTVTWQSPIQVGDRIQVLGSRDGITWARLEGFLFAAGPVINSVDSGGGFAGVVHTNISQTQTQITFYSNMNRANDDAPANPWPSSNAYWLVEKVSAGTAQGFGNYIAPSAAVPAGASGLVPAAGLPGRTDGNAVAAGNVGETITGVGTNISCATSGTTIANVTLTAGVWLIHAGGFQAGAGGGGAFDISLSTTANTGTGSNGSTRMIGATVGSVGSANIVPQVLSISANTTYYLNGFSGSGSMTGCNGSITAVRIA